MRTHKNGASGNGMFVTIVVGITRRHKMVRDERFELPASVESGPRSTSELITHGVNDGTRTRGIRHHKPTL